MSTHFFERPIRISEWISQTEAARLRGVSRQAIWKLVKKGRLRIIQVAGRTLVSRADVQRFRPRDAGRPKVGLPNERTQRDKTSA